MKDDWDLWEDEILADIESGKFQDFKDQLSTSYGLLNNPVQPLVAELPTNE